MGIDFNRFSDKYSKDLIKKLNEFKSENSDGGKQITKKEMDKFSLFEQQQLTEMIASNPTLFSELEFADDVGLKVYQNKDDKTTQTLVVLKGRELFKVDKDTAQRYPGAYYAYVNSGIVTLYDKKGNAIIENNEKVKFNFGKEDSKPSLASWYIEHNGGKFDLQSFNTYQKIDDILDGMPEPDTDYMTIMNELRLDELNKMSHDTKEGLRERFNAKLEYNKLSLREGIRRSEQELKYQIEHGEGQEIIMATAQYLFQGFSAVNEGFGINYAKDFLKEYTGLRYGTDIVTEAADDGDDSHISIAEGSVETAKAIGNFIDNFASVEGAACIGGVVGALKGGAAVIQTAVANPITREVAKTIAGEILTAYFTYEGANLVYEGVTEAMDAKTKEEFRAAQEKTVMGGFMSSGGIGFGKKLYTEGKAKIKEAKIERLASKYKEMEPSKLIDELGTEVNPDAQIAIRQTLRDKGYTVQDRQVGQGQTQSVIYSPDGKFVDAKVATTKTNSGASSDAGETITPEIKVLEVEQRYYASGMDTDPASITFEIKGQKYKASTGTAADLSPEELTAEVRNLVEGKPSKLNTLKKIAQDGTQTEVNAKTEFVSDEKLLAEFNNSDLNSIETQEELMAYAQRRQEIFHELVNERGYIPENSGPDIVIKHPSEVSTERLLKELNENGRKPHKAMTTELKNRGYVQDADGKWVLSSKNSSVNTNIPEPREELKAAVQDLAENGFMRQDYAEAVDAISGPKGLQRMLDQAKTKREAYYIHTRFKNSKNPELRAIAEKAKTLSEKLPETLHEAGVITPTLNAEMTRYVEERIEKQFIRADFAEKVKNTPADTKAIEQLIDEAQTFDEADFVGRRFKYVNDLKIQELVTKASKKAAKMFNEGKFKTGANGNNAPLRPSDTSPVSDARENPSQSSSGVIYSSVIPRFPHIEKAVTSVAKKAWDGVKEVFKPENDELTKSIQTNADGTKEILEVKVTLPDNSKVVQTKISEDRVRVSRQPSGKFLGENLEKGQPITVDNTAQFRLAGTVELDLSSPQIKAVLDGLNPGEEIIVGRTGHIKIENAPSNVSGKHLKIKKLSDNQYEVTDISRYGTEVKLQNKTKSESPKDIIAKYEALGAKEDLARIPGKEGYGSRTYCKKDGKTLLRIERDNNDNIEKVFEYVYENDKLTKFIQTNADGTKEILEVKVTFADS